MVGSRATVIYLNNAGTSWPKPPAVHEAVERVRLASPERWPDLFAAAHEQVAVSLGIEDASRFLFTPSCTSALGVALADLPWAAGDGVLTSSLEHHALARPILKLARERGVLHEALPYGSGEPFPLELAAARLQAGGVRLVAVTMASNVTGEILPVGEIVDLAHQHGAYCLIDAAQAVGQLPIDVGALGVDLLAFAGHKAPLAPQGVGGLYVAPSVVLESPAASCAISSGSDPGQDCSPFPSYCDLGSVNLAAAAGLAAGLRWIEEGGVDALRAHTQGLVRRFLHGLEALPDFIVHGTTDPTARVATVSTTHPRQTPAELEALLRESGVIVRGGQHCAPMTHQALGTGAAGTLRFSFGPFNQPDDVDQALRALQAVE